jgi:two-component system nitrate/nitrite response regulator NarL
MRVLLIDDHALFRIGLSELLERRGIEVVGVRLAAETVPDAILLDMRMPGVSGIEILQHLKRKQTPAAIVMLTTSTDERDVIDSLQSGAQGYLLKDMEPDTLIAALGRIVDGETLVAPELTSVLAKAVQGERGGEPADSRKTMAELTPREREILCLLAEGQSNKLIARNLGISDGTVKLHVKAILRKLDVHSRVEAAVIAVEQNLCARAGGATGQSAG